jgi:hypothetical protein
MIVTANAVTALRRILERNRGNAPQSLDYRIQGKLKTGLSLIGSVPFEEKGTIALDSLTGKDKVAGSGDTRS